MFEIIPLQADGQLIYGLNTYSTNELEHRVVLNAAEQKQYHQFKATNRKNEWLFVRHLLQQVLPGANICYLPSGKPYLANHSWNIAITHTKNFAALMLSRAPCVGMDAESPSDKLLRVQHKFVSENFVEPNNIHQLCLMWCAKEALYKSYSAGQLDFKKHLFVEPFWPANSGKLYARLQKAPDAYACEMHYTKINNIYLLWFEA